MTTPTAQQKRARSALEQLLGTEEGEDSVDLFVQHHLDEIEADYWNAQLGTATPAAGAVLGLLQPREPWEDEGSVHVDFELPGDVSQYVLSVELNGDGEVLGVSMES
ncbi:DUF2004 domain-containing protein [Stenotrophomonas sp. S39]|uniref:DUF2004 domain-containing protein n=1 Tax=Stenotrophomonas sp. S39 TaxID=2767451 RepID=UPI00190A72FE|nr:DUF2004 domain-containing protein [Stenotrophomonas sp. S39]MBK0053885.1 DUF2004 domain-containing protein [Stenotrophomonas sp. S39]